MTQQIIIDPLKMDRRVKIDSFNKELVNLQNKYGLKLYAANQVLGGGEVIPIVKVMDPNPPKVEKVPEKKYEDNTKKRSSPRS